MGDVRRSGCKPQQAILLPIGNHLNTFITWVLQVSILSPVVHQNLAYQKHLPRINHAQYTRPDPTRQPRIFQTLEFGPQHQNYRKAI